MQEKELIPQLFKTEYWKTISLLSVVYNKNKKPKSRHRLQLTELAFERKKLTSKYSELAKWELGKFVSL